MDAFLEEIRSLQVPMWTPDYLFEQTSGFSSTFLGGGYFGEAQLFSDARRSLVVTRMKPSAVKSFLREVRSLARVRGIEDVQQLEVIVDEGEYFTIVSQLRRLHAVKVRFGAASLPR